MHEFFEHTADLGLRIRAVTLDLLFAEAGEALIAAIVEAPESIVEGEHVQFELAGTDHDYLLFDWLRELLYRFDSEHQVFRRFVVNVHAAGLRAEGWGEQYDPARHLPNHEVKAITYHGLRVEETDDGWLAEVIVDI